MAKKKVKNNKRKKEEEEKKDVVAVEETTKIKKKPKKGGKKKKEEEEDLPAIAYADDSDSSVSSEEEEEAEAKPTKAVEEKQEESDDDEEDEDEELSDEEDETPPPPPPQPPIKPTFKSDGRYHNKQRCLIICSRGVTARYRHLLEDLRTLIPHHKKDSKLDANKSSVGGVGKAVNDIAEVKGCNTVMFLECRKRGQDAYLWMGFTSPESAGPSVRFHVSNVHTMDELRLTGNCMKGSRPVLSFDSNFDKVEHLKLLKNLFVDVFGTPRGHPKSKPFVDRVMAFYWADGKIWVRNYQIIQQVPTNAKEAHAEKKATGSDLATSLCEIGPRFVLDPIRIFRGSFGGQTLYVNSNFVPPTAQRALVNRNKGRDYEERKEAQEMKKKRDREIVVPEDPLGDVFK
uniref:Brix domain-containing protein n=1 Tax=Ditylum brightwellii TaxID=49249 RepID=A0A7S1ZC93_9STRA|mmetsp:Transcript_28623/g.42496  ORF Transcript_28623/g.42496 Transcript_28623/m.42496 type:complete len:401 (+) Transcript_28623:80-1282(+)